MQRPPDEGNAPPDELPRTSPSVGPETSASDRTPVGNEARTALPDPAEGRNATGGSPSTASRGPAKRVRHFFEGHPIRSAATAIVLVLIVAGGVHWYDRARTFEDTDDAQIDGDISLISPRVTGTVAAVHVVENQRVHAGDVLVELDPADYDVAVAQARAAVAQAEALLRAEEPNVSITETSTETAIATAGTDLASAQAELAAAERQVAQLTAELAEADSAERYAQTERLRFASLLRTQAIAPAEYDARANAADQAAAAARAAQASLSAARRRVEEQRERIRAAEARLSENEHNAPRQLEARRATRSVREAAVEVARAQLRQAELNRTYTRVIAPVDGIVGRKSVNVGDRVQPGQQLFSVTQTGRVWVTANFRETQIARMHPGQAVRVHVDALGVTLRGVVESLPGATGARYSLLPPENATGNYVKVVQRLPVRIRLEPGQGALARLRPGMSVEPEVRVR